MSADKFFENLELAGVSSILDQKSPFAAEAAEAIVDSMPKFSRVLYKVEARRLCRIAPILSHVGCHVVCHIAILLAPYLTSICSLSLIKLLFAYSSDLGGPIVGSLCL